MKLVDDWKDAWRWHSTWLAGAIAALPFVWAEMPDDLKAYIPDEWQPIVAGVMFVAFMIGRLRAQPK